MSWTHPEKRRYPAIFQMLWQLSCRVVHKLFKEVTEVGKALEKIQETIGTKTIAQVAVLYDRENSWALKDAQGPRNENMYYQECVLKQYRALREQGLNVNVISMEHVLDGYEEKLRDYVKQGGTLVLSYWSGLVDATDRCFLFGTPYRLMDVTGIRSTEIDALYDWEENHAVPNPSNHLTLQKTYRCNHLCELLEVSDGEKDPPHTCFGDITQISDGKQTGHWR